MTVDAELARWVVDALIGLTLLEFAGLWIYHRRTGRGLRPADFAADFVAGLCLMLALRCAVDQAWPWLGLCLAASGAAHALHLRRAHGAARPMPPG